MNVLSDFNKDARHTPRRSGGYEWWYFDGLSHDEKYGFVIIFYEGNPFSTRYNRALGDSKEPLPSAYPAISISIYEEGKPIYYSFTEFDEADCSFSEEHPHIQMGAHYMESHQEEDTLVYEITLAETLASGDQLDGTVKFESQYSESDLFSERSDDEQGHMWNLVQPRAHCKANLNISEPGEEERQIVFEGRGYHDHNNGNEPMCNEFIDWYWGRIHFDYATLVYYVMNHHEGERHCAWLLSDDNSTVIETFDEVSLADKGWTLFGLKAARKVGLRSERGEVQVQHSRVLDNGPFYQRYQSDAFLRLADEEIVEKKQGICEYIYPNRIYSRIFWPFVDMRIRYKKEKPHWVQRSKRLYRWTW
ncbi:hypothetical protein [Fodinibius halophilus]|uniref:Diels-Alderase N-terminal domain-containing protein n=1 Tax=Fodinibius halophilus TaxID=1736908 RepID=A0A6M1T4C9_9BACT|nr:hypothetical protein [Fodinibius halophilus]NGP88075.1 hypothetical protein [Fodinibius halophilus]